MDLRKTFVFALCAFVLVAIFSCGNDSGGSGNQTGGPIDVDKLYGFKCAVCHGREGNAMASGSPDLTKSTLTKDMVISTISMGRGKMPAQKDVLTKEEIEALASHVIGLRK
jgi:mono/diheme cytochrome c family protein